MDMFGIEEMTDKDLSFLDSVNSFLVDNSESLKEAEERLSQFDVLVLDTETEGLSPLHHKIVGVILAPSEKECYYFPLRHKIGKNLDEAEFIFFFKKLVGKVKFILANATFDWMMIYHHWGIDFEILADVIIQAYILNSDLAESGELGLKPLSHRYLGITPLELSDFGETNFSLFDPTEAYKYTVPDGTSPFRLYQIFKKEIERLNLKKVEAIELSIVKVIGKMQLTGIKIDTGVLIAQQAPMEERIEYLKKKIYSLAGREFDIDSPQQMAQVFYDELKIPPVKSHGEPSRGVGADILEQLADKHPIVAVVLNYRNVTKLYNDFVLKLPNVLAEDGRLHGNFNQTGTRSGRFSASGGFGRDGVKIKVNLQQLPKTKGFLDETFYKIPPEYEHLVDLKKTYKEGELEALIPNIKELQDGALPSWATVIEESYIKVKIRDALVPSDGYIWISADYSQLEYRMLANLAGDENLINAFAKGVDFHTATAADMFKVTVDKVTKDLRKRGKTINFGLVYGMTKWGLAGKLDCSPEEAEDLMKAYFKNKPKVNNLVETVKALVKANQYVRTYFGRIRWFKEQLDKAEKSGSFYAVDKILKQGFNTYIQGSAADAAKIALARAAEKIKPYGDKVRILSQVHDEINFEVHKSIPLDEIIAVIDDAMSFRGVQGHWADIPADIEVGECYGQLKAPEDFGVDMKSLLENVAPSDVPKGLFDPLVTSDKTTSTTSMVASGDSKSSKKEESSKKEFKTRENLAKKSEQKKSSEVTVDPVRETISKGKAMMAQREQVMTTKTKLDLTNAKFAGPTIVVSKLESANDDEAFSVLTKFIAANYGKYTLVLEYEGMLYRFPDEYHVNNSTSSLDGNFEVKQFDSAPKIKLSL